MPPDDQLVDKLLGLSESLHYDCKRMIGKTDKLLETVIAFANSEGGIIVLGIEDPAKATGRERVYGLEENMLNWDEFRRKLKSNRESLNQSNWFALYNRFPALSAMAQLDRSVLSESQRVGGFTRSLTTALTCGSIRGTKKLPRLRLTSYLLPVELSRLKVKLRRLTSNS